MNDEAFKKIVEELGKATVPQIKALRQQIDECLTEIEGSEQKSGIEAQAKTLADLQSKVYWLHQDGKWDFDTEKEAEDFLKGFERQFISVVDAEQQIQKQKDAFDEQCYHCKEQEKDAEGRLERIREWLREHEWKGVSSEVVEELTEIINGEWKEAEKR